MLPIFDPFRDITFPSLILRMFVAAVCSGVIGLERSSKNRPAGLRTHTLVCMAGVIASMTGHFLYLNLLLPTDISRMGAQVISGLGFLGAGTIIVTKKQTIKGLTTAASLWATGIIGLAIGAGFYEGGIIAAGIVLLIQLVFANVGYSIRYLPEFSIALKYDHRKALDSVMRYCKDSGLAITDLQVTSYEDEPNCYESVISLRPNKVIDKEVIIGHIRAGSYILSADIVE